tara:strand:- start:849 stop:1076 length:228 start_codon:yes stop_codon:yes gene_type:complete
MTGIIRNKLNRFYKQNVGTIIRTIIYTIGHFCIAAGVIIAVADVTIYEAMTDAIVEPLLNSMWYFILDKWWASRR